MVAAVLASLVGSRMARWIAPNGFRAVVGERTHRTAAVSARTFQQARDLCASAAVVDVGVDHHELQSDGVRFGDKLCHSAWVAMERGPELTAVALREPGTALVPEE